MSLRELRGLHFLGSVALLLFSACGRESRRSTDTTRMTGVFRVALLTPGPISDQSWNGGAYAGLERIRDSLGAAISHVEKYFDVKQTTLQRQQIYSELLATVDSKAA